MRIAPLSRPEVLQALSAGNASAAPEAPAAPAITAPASTDIGSVPPLPDPVSKPVPKPPASVPPRPGVTAGPTTTTAPPSPTPPATVATPPTAPPPPVAKPPTPTTVPKGEDRTISSRGGTVAVHYEDAKVGLLWARPNDGYDVAVVDEGPDRVFVRFRHNGSQSRVYAFYRDGAPAQEVIERGKDDDRGIESNSYDPVRQQSDWGDADWWRDEWSRERGGD